MQKRFFLLACVALILPLVLSGPALAEEKKEKGKNEIKDDVGEYRNKGIDVVQGRVFKKSMRHEFSVHGGFIPNNTFLFYETLEARYAFHFSEGLSFEASYIRAFHQEDDIIDDLGSIPCPNPGLSDIDGDGVPDQTCGVILNPGPDPVNNIFFGNLVWSPIYGKFAIFSKKIFHFDLYLLAGVGMFDTQADNRIAFDAGLGMKVFLNDWSAIRVEFRNFTVKESAPFSQIVNNRLYSVGVSFFLPLKSVD